MVFPQTRSWCAERATPSDQSEISVFDQEFQLNVYINITVELHVCRLKLTRRDRLMHAFTSIAMRFFKSITWIWKIVWLLSEKYLLQKLGYSYAKLYRKIVNHSSAESGWCITFDRHTKINILKIEKSSWSGLLSSIICLTGVTPCILLVISC